MSNALKPYSAKPYLSVLDRAQASFRWYDSENSEILWITEMCVVLFVTEYFGIIYIFINATIGTECQCVPGTVLGVWDMFVNKREKRSKPLWVNVLAGVINLIN